jgi:uncharacterized protein
VTLKDFFAQNPEVALGFSGGVDSSYLLYAASQYAQRVGAYYVKTAFQPAFEWRDAQKIAAQLGVALTPLELDILAVPCVKENREDRCYHCKKAIFSAIYKQALQDGFPIMIDGTNSSDVESDRPGMRALRQLNVRSPLRECGLTKEEIRRLSRQAGLFTWEKPAYACLATRIPNGTAIEASMLSRVEKAEEILYAMGFRDFRVRVLSEVARLQLKAAQLPMAMEMRQELQKRLEGQFGEIVLDLKTR